MVNDGTEGGEGTRFGGKERGSRGVEITELVGLYGDGRRNARI